MLRIWLVDKIAKSLMTNDESWGRSDKARDEGEHWLADQIAKGREFQNGMQVAMLEVAEQLGFSMSDITEEAYAAFRDLKAEKVKRDMLFQEPTLANLNALLD